MPINASQKVIYESFKMVDMSGQLMCYCNSKKANWYINRGLAKWIDDKTFQINFVPEGNGKANEKFYIQELKNICVVCGTEHNLNKHHVMPYVFRSRLPLAYKENNHHDILPICISCHEEYEGHASILKKELAQNVGALFNEGLTQEEVLNKKILNYQKIIEKIKNKEIVSIPDSRIVEIEDFLSKHNLVDIVDVKKKHWADYVMENLKTEEDLYQFVVMWRKHFIKIMNPRFMFEHWDVYFKLEKT